MKDTLARFLADVNKDISQRVDDADRTQYVGESFSALLVMRANKSYKRDKDAILSTLEQYAHSYGLDTRKNKDWFGCGHWLRYREHGVRCTSRDYSLQYYVEPLRFMARVASDLGTTHTNYVKSNMNLFL